ncbi:MAG: SseB family protein [Methanobrevibacter sp.]
MSELKELVEKFIEIDDDLNEKIENALDENGELDETFEEENKEQLEELGGIYHDIEHLVYHEEFIIVMNAKSEDKEIVALIISDEDEENEEFVIPVYTDEAQANEAIEVFKEQFGESEFILDNQIGNEIISDYADDEFFVGLAINAPQWDFVIGGEDVHDCCE